MSRSYWDEATGDGDLIQVQEGGAGARRAPGPTVVPIPGASQPRRTQPQQTPRATAPQAPSIQAEPEQPARRYSDEAFETAPPSVPEASAGVTSRLAKQRARTGDARGTLQRMVEGYQDPKFKEVPAFDFDGTNIGTMTSFGAKMTAPNDEAYADIIKRQLGQDFVGIERDQYNQPLVRYRDTAGKEQLRYVNRPGLDMEDVQRGVIGALPYMGTGLAMGALQKGSGLLWNMLGQGVAAGGTNAAAHQGSRLLGSNQTIDLGQAAMTTALGAGGAALARPVGVINNRARVVPSVVDDAGNLTPRGQVLAQQAGIAPEALSSPEAARAFAETYALSKDATRAATAATNTEFGIPVTAGQVTKDPQKLLLEKNYKMGVHGDAAKSTMKEFYDDQFKAIEDAATGKVAQAIAPNRNVQGMPTEDVTQMLGQGTRDRMTEAAKAARDEANKKWREVPDVRATPEALQTLPSFIQQELGKFRITPQRHPNAMEMGNLIKEFIAGKSPANPLPEVFGSTNIGTIDDLRKVLSSMRAGITDPADRKATTAIYKAFDKWQFDPNTAKALGYTVEDLAKQKTARDTTSLIKGLFEPRDEAGRLTPGAQKLAVVMKKADSPENILNGLLGAPGQKTAPPQGTVEALSKMRTIFNRAGDEGKEAWQDVGLAYWMRLVKTPRGTQPDYGVMLNNIDNAIASQGSVMRTLYTKEQMAMIQRFRHALYNVVAKDPNPSGTGTAVAYSMRQLSDTLIRALGFSGSGVAGLAVSGALSGVKNVAGGVGARRAVNPNLTGRVDPNVAPYVTGAGSMPLRTDLGEF